MKGGRCAFNYYYYIGMISRFVRLNANGRLGLRAFSTKAHPGGLELYDGKGLNVSIPASREPLYQEVSNRSFCSHPLCTIIFPPHGEFLIFTHSFISRAH